MSYRRLQVPAPCPSSTTLRTNILAGRGLDSDLFRIRVPYHSSPSRNLSCDRRQFWYFYGGAINSVYPRCCEARRASLLRCPHGVSISRFCSQRSLHHPFRALLEWGCGCPQAAQRILSAWIEPTVVWMEPPTISGRFRGLYLA